MQIEGVPMRLGGPVFGWNDPESWVREHRRWGYRAAYWPAERAAGAEEAYARAAEAADLAIAEVGIWNNVLDPDEAKRKAAIRTAQERLALADRVGARCAVNLGGTRSEVRNGPHPDNFSRETFDALVETAREIVDAVRPSRARYAVETMPWMLPDSAESAADLVRAVDRPGFAIHFDPVNVIVSPRLFYRSAALVEEFVARLGPAIAAIHLKDNRLDSKLTTCLTEVRLGLGGFDLAGFLRAIRPLGPEIPVMLEHLEREEDYEAARAHFRQVAGF